MIKCDILISGSGIAGLSAALTAARLGRSTVAESRKDIVVKQLNQANQQLHQANHSDTITVLSGAIERSSLKAAPGLPTPPRSR
jgi:thioredoxin reductase